MTDRELLEQALEALEGLADTSWTAAFKQREYDSDEPNENVERERVLGAITALRERLAQPEPAPGYCKHCKQYTIEEPLRTHWEGCEEVHPECKKPETVMAEYKFQTYAAYKTDGEMKVGVVPDDAPLTLNGVPLYPRREWVGLTQEDWLALGCKTNEEIRVGLAIQAKLKEKNA